MSAGTVLLLVGAIIGGLVLALWGAQVSRLSVALADAERALKVAEEAGRESDRVIAEQQVADRQLRLVRLAPWRRSAAVSRS